MTTVRDEFLVQECKEKLNIILSHFCLGHNLIPILLSVDEKVLRLLQIPIASLCLLQEKCKNCLDYYNSFHYLRSYNFIWLANIIKEYIRSSKRRSILGRQLLFSPLYLTIKMHNCCGTTEDGEKDTHKNILPIFESPMFYSF